MTTYTITMAGWIPVGDLYRFVHASSTRYVHVARGSRLYGDRTGRDMGGRTYYRAICTGRQIGGPWGYAVSDDAPGSVCPRCARIARLEAS